MRATGPLFQFDPGWLFVSTGLLVCAAGVLLPAQADLRALEAQLAQLHAEEARAYQRLAAHADFIDQVERSDPAIIKRLAAAQLNLVPEGDTPLLLSSANASPVTDWIDATVKLDIRPVRMAGLSTLSQWTSGPQRLWMFGAGIMAVFMGLLISPGGVRRRRDGAASTTVGDVVGVAGWDEARGTVREAAGGMAMNDACAFAAAARSTRGSVSLWIDQEEPEGDVIPLSAGAVDSLVPAALDLEEAEVSQIADTVDLDPDELLMTPVTRTVIADDASDYATPTQAYDEAGRAGPPSAVVRGQGSLTLQAQEVEHHASAADAGELETMDMIDAREGLGAGLGGRETEMLIDDPDGNCAGTGLLDAAEHARDDARDASAGSTPPAERLGDTASGDADVAAEPIADADEPLTGSKCSEDRNESQPKRRAGARRRPRRTQKRRTHVTAAQEAEVDGAPIESAADVGAKIDVEDQSPPGEEALEAGIEDDGVSDDVLSEAEVDVASIPFLRHRGRTNDRGAAEDANGHR